MNRIEKSQGYKKTINKIIVTVLIHVLSAGLIALGIVNPVLNRLFRSVNRYGISLGIILYVLPALIIAFLWGGFETQDKPIAQKVLLSLGIIINVAITIVYAFMIGQALGV